MAKKKIVLCVSSCGGHFRQITEITKNIPADNKIFVVNDNVNTSTKSSIIQITHAERNLKQLMNVLEAYRIIKKERPKLIISTGASPAVIFCIVGKWFSIPTLYIESFSRVRTLSLTGRLMLKIADEFIVQWPLLHKKYPQSQYYGNLL